MVSLELQSLYLESQIYSQANPLMNLQDSYFESELASSEEFFNDFEDSCTTEKEEDAHY